MDDVLKVACCSIVFIMFFGSAYDAINPKIKTIKYADCGVDVQNVAKKLNITILGKCEVYE